MPLAFWTPGPAELVVIGIIALVLFGRRLPKAMRGLGQGLMEFKRGLREASNLELDEPHEEDHDGR